MENSSCSSRLFIANATFQSKWLILQGYWCVVEHHQCTLHCLYLPYNSCRLYHAQLNTNELLKSVHRWCCIMINYKHKVRKTKILQKMWILIKKCFPNFCLIVIWVIIEDLIIFQSLCCVLYWLNKFYWLYISSYCLYWRNIHK